MRQGGGGEQKWRLFHKATTHSEEECRIQLDTKANNESADCPTCNPAVFGALDPPPICDPDSLCILLTIMEAPTKAAPTDVESFWPFDPTI